MNSKFNCRFPLKSYSLDNTLFQHFDYYFDYYSIIRSFVEFNLIYFMI